jgi:hypothetical protein
MCAKLKPWGPALAAALLLAAAGCSSGGGGKCQTADDCAFGQVCDADTGKCREPLACADLGCAPHQVCEPPGDGSDARCLPECEEGYGFNPDTQACDALPSCDQDAPGSILQACADAGRECLEPQPGEAECGECLDPAQVLDADTGRCRPPKTCADIECQPDQYCVMPVSGDAFCSDSCQGPDGTPGIVDPQGNCIACPACDDAGRGEDGPYLDSLSAEGKCICRTLDGYYWSNAPAGVFPCDADGDGWVRIGARAAIVSSDPVVSSNARCSLRTIDRFVLHNEAGHTREVFLGSALPLYESDRNDDQAEIDRLVAAGDNSIPVYGRALEAEELNSLTRACVSATADYNHNGVEDINEAHGLTAGVSASYLPYVDFTYYLELHSGWFEPGGAGAGSYHIQEKSRAADAAAGRGVPVVRNPDEGDFWRSCIRKRDAAFSGAAEKQGLDFGEHLVDMSDPQNPWGGMNHHSQFKCLHIFQSPPPNPRPHELTRAEVVAEGYLVNQCAAQAGSAAPVAPPNPSDPVVECQVLEPTPETGVLWAAAGFENYGPNQPGADYYTRGCVDECAELFETCPNCQKTRESCDGHLENPEFTHCVGDPDDFGRLFCGCGLNFGGVKCDYVCAGDDPRDAGFDPAVGYTSLFLQADFELAPRTGYWLCGGVTQTAHDPAEDPLLCQNAGCASGYTMSGRVPAGLKTDADLCEDPADCSSGYSLY